MTEQSDYASPAALAAPRRFQVELAAPGRVLPHLDRQPAVDDRHVGIYSAWAKVRKMQYFYRNTRVDGAIFDYTPAGAILKGRIIVLVLAMAYNLSFRFSLTAGIVVALALAVRCRGCLRSRSDSACTIRAIAGCASGSWAPSARPT